MDDLKSATNRVATDDDYVQAIEKFAVRLLDAFPADAWGPERIAYPSAGRDIIADKPHVEREPRGKARGQYQITINGRTIYLQIYAWHLRNDQFEFSVDSVDSDHFGPDDDFGAFKAKVDRLLQEKVSKYS